jgi:hypothetical protein
MNIPYLFFHIELPGIVLSSAQRSYELLKDSNGLNFLLAIWQKIVLEAGGTDEAPEIELSWVPLQPNGEIFLVKPLTPVISTDPLYIAMAYKLGYGTTTPKVVSVRYFTLELSSPGSYYFCEWRTGSKHLNFGHLEGNQEHFLQAVSSKLSEFP